MISGTIAKLTETVADPIQDYQESGQRAIDVETSIQYLDNHRVQKGQIAGPVKQQTEVVDIVGSSIDVEERTRDEVVAAEWLADVQSDGWILADRTFTTEEEHLPDWPFSMFQRKLGIEIHEMAFDVHEFVTRQREEDRSISVEMASIEGEESEDVRINWGRSVSKEQALRSNVGCALTVHWNGSFIRLVIYESGYTAIWSEENLTAKVGRFIHEEIAPIAVPEYELEDDNDVQTEVTS